MFCSQILTNILFSGRTAQTLLAAIKRIYSNKRPVLTSSSKTLKLVEVHVFGTSFWPLFESGAIRNVMTEALFRTLHL